MVFITADPPAEAANLSQQFPQIAQIGKRIHQGQTQVDFTGDGGLDNVEAAMGNELAAQAGRCIRPIGRQEPGRADGGNRRYWPAVRRPA